MNEKLFRLLTGYVMPLLGLLMLAACLTIYLIHHGRLLPHFNQ